MSESEEADPANTEPKIIVDDDWKQQVAKDRAASVGDPAAESSELQDEEIPPPPPATFEILISMMFTQGLSMLGQIPDPAGQMMPVNKPYAKHTIDTMEMLGEKTKGNLTEDESNMLAEALHALRMAYVNAKA